MLPLSSDLHNRCRDALLQCQEFDNNGSLRAVFVTEELSPFRERLPEATSKTERVDSCLDFLLSLRLADGRAGLPLFLKALSARYDPLDALHGELNTVCSEIVKLNHSENRGYSEIPITSRSERHNHREHVRDQQAARIFLCYAREDRANVGTLYHDLAQAGFTPWMDIKDLLPGQPWKVATQKAIQEADFFLVCLSNASVNQRGHLQKELKHALDLWQEKLEDDIYVIPARLENCEVPDSLADFTWLISLQQMDSRG